MLPKPYEFISNIGFNDYYYFKLSGYAYGYLAVSTVDELVEIKKRRFFKDKIKNHEIPMGLKLLPLNSLVLFFIYQASLLKAYTHELDVDNNKIDIYNEWDEFDLNDVKKVFKEAIIKNAGSSNYEINPVIHNPVAKGFDRDGFMYVATENVNLLNRSYWLLRTTQYGNMHFIEVKESGIKGKSLTVDVNEVLLDRSLINRIAQDLDSGKFVEDDNDVDITEIEDLDEMREI